MKRPCFFYHEIKRGIFQKGGTMLREKTKEIKIGDVISVEITQSQFSL